MKWQQINGKLFNLEDKKELRKQVNRFNSKLKRIEKKYKNDDILLPDFLSTQELKKEIRSRKDLNNFYKMVNRFMEKDSAIKVDLNINSNKTKVKTILFEKEEIIKNAQNAKRNINKQLKNLRKMNLDSEKINPYNAITFKESEKEKLQDTLERLNINKTKDIIDIERFRKRALRYSTESRMFRKMEIYKENYLKSLNEVFKYEEGYKELYNKIKILSPKKFYDLIKTDKIVNDIKAFYREKYNDRYNQGGDISGYFERIKDKWDEVLTE